MLKKIVNVAMVLSVCLSIGYAKPLKECKSERDRLNGCVEQRYYDDDRRKLQVETPYKNGKINGVKKVYYESGQLSRETLFENGKLMVFKNPIINLGSLNMKLHTKW